MNPHSRLALHPILLFDETDSQKNNSFDSILQLRSVEHG